MDLMLDKTKALITGKYININPQQDLVYLLESVIELLSIPDNDFCWSSWKDASEAINEIRNIINKIMENDYSVLKTLGVIFTVTGPLQEVSISSGWGDVFIKIADKYDLIENQICK